MYRMNNYNLIKFEASYNRDLQSPWGPYTVFYFLCKYDLNYPHLVPFYSVSCCSKLVTNPSYTPKYESWDWNGFNLIVSALGKRQLFSQTNYKINHCLLNVSRVKLNRTKMWQEQVPVYNCLADFQYAVFKWEILVFFFI